MLTRVYVIFAAQRTPVFGPGMRVKTGVEACSAEAIGLADLAQIPMIFVCRICSDQAALFTGCGEVRTCGWK